ncbi:LysM peptidoglycan-binding domain-containing protein [Butyrivibrio sp. LC3010]|uniref:LysM peptidoglycan-binding domain-containing protein n=1 Tax=Butyrivibrio sp. LC3010 TaxID=1280680 RepID=UPI0006781843|nr:LysM peptidoglycan-binding domain-containing protein [Butyrivibrio sp. LC3010]
MRAEQRALTRRNHRREVIIKRRIITFCIMASIILSLFIILSFSFNSDASANSDNEQFRYYTSVSVTSGDSVWSIAEEYMDELHYRNTREYVTDIAHINRISPDSKLRAGTNLIIPYYSELEK